MICPRGCRTEMEIVHTPNGPHVLHTDGQCADALAEKLRTERTAHDQRCEFWTKRVAQLESQLSALTSWSDDKTDRETAEIMQRRATLSFRAAADGFKEKADHLEALLKIAKEIDRLVRLDMNFDMNGEPVDRFSLKHKIWRLSEALAALGDKNP